MSTAREPCPNCQLPFYTDRNDDCPYCGSTPGPGEPGVGGSEAVAADPTHETASVDTAPAGSVRRETPPSRPRTTCSQCGLDHYADDDGGCPYCSAAAGGSADVEATTTDTAPEPAAPSAAGGGADDRTARQSGDSGGLLSRLLGMFGR